MKLNKITSLFILTCIFCLQLPVKASASGRTDIDEYSLHDFSVSEYEMLMVEKDGYEKELMNIPAADNKHQEYSKALDSVRRIIESYPLYIEELNEKTDDELKELNYTTTQIDAIRFYDGSAEMTALASATVNGSYGYSNYNYNSSQDKTYVTTSFTASWNGSPLIKGQDTMCVGLIGSNAAFGRSYSSNSVTYRTGTISNTANQVWQLKGISYAFGIADINSNIFTSATVSYRGVATGRVTVFAYGACYAHATVSATASISVGLDSSGSLNITFVTISNSVQKMFEGARTVSC